MDADLRKGYKAAAAVKNDEMIEQVFERVLKKANVDYGELTRVENEDVNGNLLYEEDFDKSFDYPLKGDIRKYMEQLRLGKELDQVYLVTFKNGPFPASFLYFWSFQTNITIYRSI